MALAAVCWVAPRCQLPVALPVEAGEPGAHIVGGVLRLIPLHLRHPIPPLDDGDAEAFIVGGDRRHGESPGRNGPLLGEAVVRRAEEPVMVEDLRLRDVQGGEGRS